MDEIDKTVEEIFKPFAGLIATHSELQAEQFLIAIERELREIAYQNGGHTAEEKLTLPWQESELIGGDPLYFLDDSHGVSIADYINRIEIRFYERVKEGGQYYCRTFWKHGKSWLNRLKKIIPDKV